MESQDYHTLCEIDYVGKTIHTYFIWETWQVLTWEVFQYTSLLCGEKEAATLYPQRQHTHLYLGGMGVECFSMPYASLYAIFY
jgi:hypothetical protein